MRDYLHIEHSPWQHALTNGREKYLWHVADGREQFFDLESDPHELCDLGGKAEARERVAGWRQRMIEELGERPEGFSDGRHLLPGRAYPPVLPHALPEGEREPR